MKTIQTVALTFVAALALSTSTSFADNAVTLSSDGFLELTLHDEVKKEVKKPVKIKKAVTKTTKKVKPKVTRKKRVERKKKTVRVERKKRYAKLKTYKVRRGDTLTKISRRTGVSVSRLIRMNRLYGSKKNNIQTGQRLRIR